MTAKVVILLALIAATVALAVTGHTGWAIAFFVLLFCSA